MQSPNYSKKPSVLAVGCGSEPLDWWAGFEVVRLDIDPRTSPDIVASMVDMGDIGQYDAVYCSHALEHLYPHEVPRALSEFYRVLKPNSSATIVVPNLDGVPATDEPLPGSEHLTGLHLYYGEAQLIEEFPHMAHHSGFVPATLASVLSSAGFEPHVMAQPHYNLVGIGVKR
jgi:SAM-dependent methyltransferase